MARRLVAIGLTALLLGSCSSSSGAVSQPDDEFLDSVESLCRDAAREIRKLDVQDSAAAGDLHDILSQTADDLSALNPPRKLAKVYDQYTANLDDQVNELESLLSARAAGDVATEISAGDRIDSLRSDNDSVVNNLRISSCRGITPRRGLAVTDTEGEAAPDNTDVTTDTTVTVDDETSVPDAVPTLEAYDTATVFKPADGYQWGTIDLTDTYTPAEDAVLGPIIDSYGVGLMESTTDDSSVFLYAFTLVDGATWTQEAMDAYYSFELVGDGTETTLANTGLSARVKKPAFEGTDVAVAIVDNHGFAVFADSGIDVADVLDRFILAQAG